MATERDTHFKQSALSLLREMDKNRLISEEDILAHQEELSTIFSQFAYDISCHTVRETTGSQPQKIVEIVDNIADLPQWPIE